MINTLNFTTDNGIKIHSKIESGQTLLADSLELAKKMAKENNSFYYQVYEDGRTVPYYGIPK